MASSSEDPASRGLDTFPPGTKRGKPRRSLQRIVSPEPVKAPLGIPPPPWGLPGHADISNLSFQRLERWTFARVNWGHGSASCWSPAVAQVERQLRAWGEAGGRSEAEVELLAHEALVALHHAAPVEAAQAVLLQLHALLAVPAAAAQQVAAAEVQGAAVAGAAARARRACAPVGGAEVGRVGDIEQVGATRRLEMAGRGQQSLAVVGAHDTRGAVEALEQLRAHLSERGQLLPAGAQSAGARQPVALAFRARMAPHRLQGAESRRMETNVGCGSRKGQMTHRQKISGGKRVGGGNGRKSKPKKKKSAR